MKSLLRASLARLGHCFVAVIAFVLAAAAGPAAAAVSTASLIGTWEAARTADDERLYVRLLDKGKAEIVAEYDFELPGAPGKRRGRSTTYGKWTVKGDDVLITYAQVKDKLRYSDKLPLSEIGLEGASPALKPAGKLDAKSKIRATLWKTPHEYKLKPAPAPAGKPAADK